MMFRKFLPCPALRPYVRNYLLVHLTYAPDNFPKTPYPVRLEQALCFFVHGHITSYDPLQGTTRLIAPNALFGQQVSRLDFQCHVTNDFLMLHIVFQPGAMFRLLGFSSNELTHVFCDAESILSAELAGVNEQLGEASDYAAMLERLETYMLGKLKKIRIDAHPIDRIGQLLLTNPTRFSLDWLADQANLSPRQFERKFNERIGIGPKLYSRIGRFFQALNYRETHPDLDWLSVAVQFGYTDYNHLAKDFRQFANVTPSIMFNEYIRRPEFTVNL